MTMIKLTSDRGEKKSRCRRTTSMKSADAKAPENDTIMSKCGVSSGKIKPNKIEHMLAIKRPKKNDGNESEALFDVREVLLGTLPSTLISCVSKLIVGLCKGKTIYPTSSSFVQKIAITMMLFR